MPNATCNASMAWRCRIRQSSNRALLTRERRRAMSRAEQLLEDAAKTTINVRLFPRTRISAAPAATRCSSALTVLASSSASASVVAMISAWAGAPTCQVGGSDLEQGRQTFHRIRRWSQQATNGVRTRGGTEPSASTLDPRRSRAGMLRQVKRRDSARRSPHRRQRWSWNAEGGHGCARCRMRYTPAYFSDVQRAVASTERLLRTEDSIAQRVVVISEVASTIKLNGGSNSCRSRPFGCGIS